MCLEISFEALAILNPKINLVSFVLYISVQTDTCAGTGNGTNHNVRYSAKIFRVADCPGVVTYSSQRNNNRSTLRPVRLVYSTWGTLT